MFYFDLILSHRPGNPGKRTRCWQFYIENCGAGCFTVHQMLQVCVECSACLQSCHPDGSNKNKKATELEVSDGARETLLCIFTGLYNQEVNPGAQKKGLWQFFQVNSSWNE